MPSEETKGASPQWSQNTYWAKGLWALSGLTISTVVRHTTGRQPSPWGGSRLWSNRRKTGGMCPSTSTSAPAGKVHG